MVLLIVDNNYIYQECYFTKGVSVLSKMKEISEYKGQHIGDILNNLQDEQDKNKKKTSALTIALSKAIENAFITISKRKFRVNQLKTLFGKHCSIETGFIYFKIKC